MNRSGMTVWNQARWHLCLLLLGVALISLYLWQESGHLSEGHSVGRGLPHSSSDAGPIRGQAGSDRPAPIDSGDSMADRNRVPPAYDAMGGARERYGSGGLLGSPDARPVKAAGYPVERISPGLGQTGEAAPSRNPTGTRSVHSSTMSPPAIPALAPSAVRDVNPGGTDATTSGYKVANNGEVTGGAVAGSLGMSVSPAETPVSPSPPTMSEGSVDATSRNSVAREEGDFSDQATAEDLYRAKYGWATYGEFIRRQTIDAYNAGSVPNQGSAAGIKTPASLGQ